MANTLEVEFTSFEDIKTNYPFWNQFPLVKEAYTRGKKPCILHYDVDMGTLAVSAPVEIADPAVQCVDFASPLPIFIRSDDAGDTGKTIYVIGQKSTGEFGKFMFTSDAVDGTTAVDEGTWNFICWVEKIDAWAGNVIIDDDGASGTVYFTQALGVSSPTGILCIPEGYTAGAIDGSSRSTEGCGSNTIVVSIEHIVNFFIEQYNPVQRQHNASIIEDGQQILIKAACITATVTGQLHFMICLWEQ